MLTLHSSGKVYVVLIICRVDENDVNDLSFCRSPLCILEIHKLILTRLRNDRYCVEWDVKL